MFLERKTQYQKDINSHYIILKIVNTIPIKIPRELFDKLILKFMWKNKQARLAREMQNRENVERRAVFP
jgi:hypothetical protein